MATLNLDQIREALAGKAAAFRSVTEYQPACGPGDKVFPPTYGRRRPVPQGGIYATEQRYIDGADVSCVLLDSVQSQANRMEMALLDEWESERAHRRPLDTRQHQGRQVPHAGIRRFQIRPGG